MRDGMNPTREDEKSRVSVTVLMSFTAHLNLLTVDFLSFSFGDGPLLVRCDVSWKLYLWVRDFSTSPIKLNLKEQQSERILELESHLRPRA